MSGWICLHRKFLSWEWYSDLNTKSLFIHLLIKANFEDKKWQGVEIKRGQFLTGRKVLAKETGLSEQQVRTALERLKSTNEITIKSTSRYSIITLNNYNTYQDEQPANQPTDNQRVTTTNNINNKNKYIHTHGKILKNYGSEFNSVLLTEDDYNKFIAVCLSKELANDLINDLDIAISRGKYQGENHYATLLAFLKNRRIKKNIGHQNPIKKERKYPELEV